MSSSYKHLADKKLTLPGTKLDDTEKQIQQAKWLIENKTRLDACNKLMDNNGLFSDTHRPF